VYILLQKAKALEKFDLSFLENFIFFW